MTNSPHLVTTPSRHRILARVAVGALATAAGAVCAGLIATASAADATPGPNTTVQGTTSATTPAATSATTSANAAPTPPANNDMPGPADACGNVFWKNTTERLLPGDPQYPGNASAKANCTK